VRGTRERNTYTAVSGAIESTSDERSMVDRSRKARGSVTKWIWMKRYVKGNGMKRLDWSPHRLPIPRDYSSDPAIPPVAAHGQYFILKRGGLCDVKDDESQ
jgi:hypothetical protein